MREIILGNERYAAVEIDKNGIITGNNRNAGSLFSELLELNNADDLRGRSITQYAGSFGVSQYDLSNAEKILTSIKGIKHIDSIFYKDTESIIARFISNMEVFTPFFDLIKSSSVLNIEFDDKLNIIFVPESFCRTAKLEKSEICGVNLSCFTDKNSLSLIYSAAENCKNKTAGIIKIDGINFSFNGIACNYDVEMFPVNNVRGEFCGVVCHFADKFFQNKCQEMNRSIRRMSAVANFAGGIAHDYNNALTAVLGNISLAKMDAEKNSELEELLRDAESAGMKIKILTERLGMFSRGMKPAKDKTDIKKLIESTVPEILADYKGHYRFSIAENMAQPEIDRQLISETFRHVVENAIDASDKPDGEIVITAEEIEIKKESVFREISLVSGKYILVSVRDNGSGIDQLASREIFDPYITTKPGREGLGLAIVYTILKRHRGFISAGTPENGGADFKIYLPLF